MRFSEHRGEIARAIMAVQDAVPTVKKTKLVEAGQYTYKYVPHELAWAGPIANDNAGDNEQPTTLQKTCKRLNLSISQGGREGAGGTQWLVTSITHVESGQWLESDVRVESAKAGFQAMGAAWSYARRIALLAALGIVAEADDTDAQNELTGRAAKPRQTPAARPPGVTDDRQAAEAALIDLPKLTTKAQIDELGESLKGKVPKDMTDRVRKAFAEARAAVAAKMGGA